MTGVSAFLLFSQAHNHHTQGRTLIMSQSFTSMDARTQPLTKQDIKEVDADYLRVVLRSGNPDARTRKLMEEELVRRETPRYFPEPEGDPSY